nr:tetratricopeptide repeat protein [Dactylosporangium sucinum]
MHVLHGLGGCGKTSIALEVAHHAIDTVVPTWWVTAADHGSLVAGMHAVARRLGADTRELEHGDAPDVLWRLLNNLRMPWLLVLDNADDPGPLAGASRRLDDGIGWLRPVAGAYGLVVVTTRDGRPGTWATWCTCRLVDVLEPADATAVLLDNTGGRAGNAVDAAMLAERLGNLPLALRHAGAYLAETTTTPWPDADAITTFAGYHAALDAGRLPSNHPDTATDVVEHTWRLSLDLLDRRGITEAPGLLRLLSSFADSPTPYQILLDPTVLARSSIFADVSGARLWDAIRALAGLGLAHLTGHPGRERLETDVPVIRLHPMLHELHRPGRLEPASRDEYQDLRLQLLLHAIRLVEGPEDPTGWPEWGRVAPHALHALREYAAVQPPRPAMAEHCAVATIATRYLKARGLYEVAELHYQEILAAAIPIAGDTHPEVLETRHYLAMLRHDRGHYADSAAEFRAVYAARRQVLGEHHPDTLATRLQVADALSHEQRLEEAEQECRAVLRLRSDTLGPDHADTLHSRHQLAYLLRDQGLYAQAATEYRGVLEAQTRVLGADDPRAIMVRDQLAHVLYQLGDHASAEREARAVYEYRIVVLGDAHPDTLLTRRTIADVLRARGDHEDAARMYAEILSRQREVLGDDHPWMDLVRQSAAENEAQRLGQESS